MKKISEMSFDELSVTLCKIANPVANIFGDGAVIDAFASAAKDFDGNSHFLRTLSAFASKIVPVLLGDAHKMDTYAILAAFEGVTIEDIKAQNGIKIAKDLYQLFMTDTEAADAFRADKDVRPE